MKLGGRTWLRWARSMLGAQNAYDDVDGDGDGDDVDDVGDYDDDGDDDGDGDE